MVLNDKWFRHFEEIIRIKNKEYIRRYKLCFTASFRDRLSRSSTCVRVYVLNITMFEHSLETRVQYFNDEREIVR